MKKEIMSAAACLVAVAGLASAQVQHGVITVVENDGGNDPTSVSLSRLNAAPCGGDWMITGGNRGDYDVDFGTGADAVNGVLITGSYNDERVETTSFGGVPYFATTAAARGSTDNLFIAVHASPAGSEANYDAALAYFPLADNWLAGSAYNSANGGIITELVSSTISPTNPFVPDPGGSVLLDQSNGQFGLRLDGLDMRRDGVLLATGAKNEDNFGMAFVNFDGTGLVLNHDNGANGASFEQDPVAFVFVTYGTPGVVMGRVSGGARKLYSQGEFEVELFDRPTTNGTFRLTIPGQSPSTGTLLVTPYNELRGNTIDNPVFVVPQADGSWLISTRDIAGMGLQNIGAADVAFHFAFFPCDVPNIVPGTPAQDYMDRLDDVVAARFAVTEFQPDNGNGDMRADRVAGSDALDIYGDNRGDVGISWLDARLAARIDNGQDGGDMPFDGLMFGMCSELFRFNNATGGPDGWGTFSFDNGEARTHVAGAFSGELNIDFAAAFFPTVAGFMMAGDLPDVIDGQLDVDVAPASAENDGVLFALNWDNSNRFATVSQTGTTYTIQGWDGTTGAALGSTDNFDVGYVYLPYATENLVAGRVAADGSIVSGTTGSGEGAFNFSASLGTDSQLGFGVIEIMIPGVDAATDGGVILANAESGPFAVSWEAGENGEFEIAAFDVSTETPGVTDISFAYIPAEGLMAPAAPMGCNIADISEPFDTLDIDDVLAFLNAFAAGDAAADVAPPMGTLDIDDVLAFLNAFAAGCP